MQVSYRLNGKEVSQEEFTQESNLEALLEEGECLAGQSPGCWPMVSRALQVHPRQIPAVLERNRRAGINVEYQPDGQPVLTDRGKRRELLRVERKHDNNGGYGD